MSMYWLQAYQGLGGHVSKCPCVKTITCNSNTPAHKPRLLKLKTLEQHHNWNPHWENKPIWCFCRFRPTQTKAKKTKTETKLEFFGFEDKEEEEGEEGPEGGASGKSSYKIKYFGFDDLSESDSEDESCQVKEKKARKAAAALASLSSSVDSPHTSDSQDSQASSNTGEFFLFLTHTHYAADSILTVFLISLPFVPSTIWFSHRCLWLLWWIQSWSHRGTKRTHGKIKW